MVLVGLNMALRLDWDLQPWCVLWIFTLLVSESQAKRTQTYFMDGGIDCGNTKYIGGATVYSQKRVHYQYYGINIECTIHFKTENEGWKLMLRVVDLDIPDMDADTHICNDALYVYDGKNIYSTPMRDAGGNRGLCGTALPKTMISSGQYLTLHFRANGRERPSGHGFKFILTAFSNDYDRYGTCGTRFMCADSKICIDEDLVCDSVDHCRDRSDESMGKPASCHSITNNSVNTGTKEGIIDKFTALGITAAVTITVGSLIVIIVCIITAVCCCRRFFCKKAPETTSNVSPPGTTATSSVANGAPPSHAMFSNVHGNLILPRPIEEGEESYKYQQYGMSPSDPLWDKPMHVQPTKFYNNVPGRAPANVNVYNPMHTTQQGYFPLQPVFHSPNHTAAIYSAYREGLANSAATSAYSSQSHSHPPSYHRSATPTSSRSGRSQKSNNSASVTYSQGNDKVTLPINL